jgi:hypothetical protein
VDGQDEQKHGECRDQGNQQLKPAFARVHGSTVEPPRQGSVSAVQGKR